MLSLLYIAALWSPEGKGLTSWLLFVMFIVILLLSHLVSWDRCGTSIVLIPDPCCLSYFNPLCTNGFFILVLYNKLGMVNCLYPGATGKNFQIKLHFFH